MIENYQRLAVAPLEKAALDIMIAGVMRVMPGNFMPDQVTFDSGILTVCGDPYDLRGGNLYVIGGGKAAGAMAVEFEKIVEPAAGIVNDKTTDFPTRSIRVHQASHPVPSPDGVAGMRQMLELTNGLTKSDTVICLISGGGSSLMTYPVEDVDLADLQELTTLLLKAGVDVYEINVIRKHLSRVKGGKLARHLQPAQVIGLILSDTLKSEGETASGPTSVDDSSFEQAYDILVKHQLLRETPQTVVEHIRKGLRGEVSPTVQSMREFVTPVRNYVLADNAMALSAMQQKADSLGFRAQRYPNRVTGEARAAAAQMGRFYRGIREKGGTAAVVSGGETTVTVRGNGRGGRNQEYMAAMIPEIKDCANTVVASMGTDGVDFLEGVAGAIITGSALKECQAKGLELEEFLRNNNTYELHRRLGSLIETKPTHTNVADISVYLQEA